MQSNKKKRSKAKNKANFQRQNELNLSDCQCLPSIHPLTSVEISSIQNGRKQMNYTQAHDDKLQYDATIIVPTFIVPMSG